MMVVVFIIVFMRSPRFLRFKLGFYRLGWSKAIFGRLNSLGWPIAFQMGMETASFSLSAVMIGWLGTIALASHQVMLAISQFTFMMYYGMGAAVAVRVSNFNGQGDILNVRRSAYAGFHLMMALGVVLSSIVFLCRNYLGGWFTDSTEVAAMVTSLILPFLVYQFGDGLQITFANALRGISDVKLMMLIAFIAYFLISLPVGYFCGFVLEWGIIGVWNKVLCGALIAFFPLYGLGNMLPDFIANKSILTPLLLIITSLSKFAFMLILVSGVIFAFYRTNLHDWLMKITPYGKMSLTNYITQSIIGSLLFYNWGLALHSQLGITASFLVGVALFIIQLAFCRWWMSRHAHGPLEYLWKRATWLK